MLRIVLPVLILTLAGNVSLAAPLHDAAGAGDLEETKALLDAGANPDEQGENGETPLNMAILASHDAVALMLLESGASIGARNRGGFTPLHAAAYAGAPQIASALLDAGADVNDRRNKAGVSPLSVAAEEGHADVAKVLIDRGAEIELAEQNGYTPLTRALWRGQQQVIALLRAAGASCQPVEILGEPDYAKCMAGQK